MGDPQIWSPKNWSASSWLGHAPSALVQKKQACWPHALVTSGSAQVSASRMKEVGIRGVGDISVLRERCMISDVVHAGAELASATGCAVGCAIEAGGAGGQSHAHVHIARGLAIA